MGHSCVQNRSADSAIFQEVEKLPMLCLHLNLQIVHRFDIQRLGSLHTYAIVEIVEVARTLGKGGSFN